MDPLTFPTYEFDIREDQGRPVIRDTIRKQWVRLSPEEWVRQHVIQFLMKEKGVPAGLIGIEKGFVFQGMQRRADIIVHDRLGSPLLMVECKAPAIMLDQAVFDQIARYNLVIRASYLYVTNGLQHYCYKIDEDKKSYVFLKEMPAYGML